jgi:hypothetical protein
MDNNLTGLISLFSKNPKKKEKGSKYAKYRKFRKNSEGTNSKNKVNKEVKKSSKYNKFKKNKNSNTINVKNKTIKESEKGNNTLLTKSTTSSVNNTKKTSEKKGNNTLLTKSTTSSVNNTKKTSEKKGNNTSSTTSSVNNTKKTSEKKGNNTLSTTSSVNNTKKTSEKKGNNTLLTKSTTSSVNNTKKTSEKINNLEGWVKHNVKGDGSCAFHSIMLYFEKTKQKNTLHKKYGNNGHSLRNGITKNVETHLNIYEKSKNSSNIKKFLNSIYKHPLVNSNKNTIIKHMKESHQLLKDYSIYSTNDELQIISAMLCKKIFVYNESEKKWHNISIPKEECPNLQIKDSIFLYFNINHYQLLLPDEKYEFKKSYTNLPKNEVFDYNFLQKK